jgi:hypothetical protein
LGSTSYRLTGAGVGYYQLQAHRSRSWVVPVTGSEEQELVVPVTGSQEQELGSTSYRLTGAEVG